jgi:phospholipid/cholesterol/gamma-HCH transport system substrate-binding protein
MDERVVQFRVGVMVLAALIVTGIMMLLFGELPAVLRGNYTIYVKFPSAPGVGQDTPIRKNGIHIGRVSRVQFAPDNEVLVTASIEGGIELFRDEMVKIKSGLLGDAELEFVPGPRRPDQRVRVQAGDLLAGAVAVDPLQAFANIEGNLSRAADSLATAGEEVGKLAKNVNDVFGDNRGELNQIIRDTSEAVKDFRAAMVNVNEVIGDPKAKQDLKDTLARMPKLLEETQKAVKDMEDTMGVANEDLKNMQTFTRALDQRGEQIIANLSGSTEQLEGLLTQLNKFTRTLNNKEGTLGQLANNPDLYNNLNRATMNVTRITQEIEPILCNVKVITDKVARNPGVIIRDAVSPGPGLK